MEWELSSIWCLHKIFKYRFPHPISCTDDSKLRFSIWNLGKLYFYLERRKKWCIREKQRSSEKPFLSFFTRVPSEVKWGLHIGERVNPLERMISKLKVLYLSTLRRVPWLRFQGVQHKSGDQSLLTWSLTALSSSPEEVAPHQIPVKQLGSTYCFN